MWWSSFVSVLHDLWLFCTGRLDTVSHSPSSDHLLAFSARQAASSVTAKLVQQLQSGVQYGADQAVTCTIRAELSGYDPHLVQASDLTEKEWLLYVVHSKSPAVPLLALQLTPIGRWHTTLRGQSAVSVSITPYTHSLMEWSEEMTGKVALVLQVTPDETITIGELGVGRPGLFEKRTLVRSQWLELRPVYTAFV